MPEAQKEDIIRSIREKGCGIRLDLPNRNLFNADLSNTELVGANLSGCDLSGANLSNADLTKANLKGTRLWHADLSGAKLVEADLGGADLWGARLYNARLWRANITGTHSLTKQSFLSPRKGVINSYKADESGYITAEESYRSLKLYFIQNGRYNDASWASFKEKTMEKMRLKKERDLTYLPMAVMGFLCGYGEKPQRIIFSSLLLIFIYGIIYYLLKSVMVAASNNAPLTFGDHLYFSIVTFTTVGYGDVIPKTYTLYRLLAVSEAFLGAFMMGLFVFTLARRYSAR